MDIFINFNLNNISFGAIIGAVFSGYLSFKLLTIPQKSKATWCLALAFIHISIMSAAYIWSFGLYHQNMAYHAIITNYTALMNFIFLTQFFYYYPTETRERFSRILFFAQWAIALFMIILWIATTNEGHKVFRLNELFWDLERPKTR